MIYSRLSFNTNGWVLPSGPIGKSKSDTTFEYQNGFGFEEWLFNNSACYRDKKGIIWNFGYIEGIHKNYRHGDENYPLELFTIDARTKNRYIVAEINEWKAISQNESSIIINQHPNLIQQMRADFVNINNNNALFQFNNHLYNLGNCQLFNIIYKDFNYLFNLNTPLPKNNQIYSLQRFHLYR